MAKIVEKKDQVKIVKKDLDDVSEIANKLLSLIGVNAKADVIEDTKNKAILIDIQTEKESGLLIGSRGETLLSLQTIISMIFQAKNDKWVRILLNIADWRNKEEERLQSMAQQIAERVRATGETQTLYNLTANQRRIIHTALAETKDVITESLGEGKNRYLTVKLK
jgi:spoIIIJ-associated protein